MDAIQNVVDGWDQVAAGTDQSDGNLACVFQRPASNAADPTEDIALSGDLESASISAMWVQGGSFSDMTSAALSGSVINLDYVTPPPVENTDDTLADDTEEEVVMESSMLLSASVATLAVVASLA